METLKALFAMVLQWLAKPVPKPAPNMQPQPSPEPQTPSTPPPTPTPATAPHSASQTPSEADILRSDIVFADWIGVAHVRHNMRVIADLMGLSLIQKDLLCDIGACESGLNPHAKLINNPQSIDRGLFQWNNHYHPEITDAMAYNPDTATRLACKAILSKQIHVYWSASQPCWNKSHKYDHLL
jgi:hypothetical protein